MKPSRPSPMQRLNDKLRPAWERLAQRERRAVLLAALVVGLGLLWGLGVAPALKTLRQAPEQHSRLDAQLQDMQGMAAAAERLRAQGDVQAISPEVARQALQRATTDTLAASAQLTVQGDRATVTLRGASPEALSRWLMEVRVNARLVPLQADLQRTDGAPGWTGQLVLGGPGLGTGD